MTELRYPMPGVLQLRWEVQGASCLLSQGGGWQGRCSSYLHLVILIFRVEASSGFLHDLLCFFSAVLACVANSRHSDGVLTRELPR